MTYAPPASGAAVRHASDVITAAQYLGEVIEYPFDFLPMIQATNPNDTIVSAGINLPAGNLLTQSGTTSYLNTTSGTQARIVYAKLGLALTATPGNVLPVTCTAQTTDGQNLVRNLLITVVADAPPGDPGASAVPTVYLYPADTEILVFDFSDHLASMVDTLYSGMYSGGVTDGTAPQISAPAQLSIAQTPAASPDDHSHYVSGIVHGSQVWVTATVQASGTNAATPGNTYAVTCRAYSRAGRALTKKVNVQVLR